MDHVKKFLAKLQPKLRDRIERAMQNIYLRNLAEYQVKRMSGVDHIFRIRIGQYRIIFYMDSTHTHIINVNKRDDNTYHNL